MAVSESSICEILPPLLRESLCVDDIVIDRARRLTAGASALSWLLEARIAGAERTLILRLDAGGESFGMTPGKQAEARVQQAARQAGAPCPEVLLSLADHPELGDGYVMAAVVGESLPRKLLRDDAYAGARERLPGHIGEALARIHDVPSAELADLPLLDAATQLEQLHGLHRQFGESLPVFSLAYQWLSEHAPACPEPALVHGDYRMGNFMVDEQGLVSVLDWEMAHRGDPMEDLGWLCVNAWRFGYRERPVAGLSDRESFYRAYEAASGRSVDRAHARYWELFGTFKWGVICQYQAFSHLNGQVRSPERAAIGRRVAETEYDMLVCLRELVELNDAA